MRACGYVRVSSEKQKEQGSSLEAQTEKIKAMALLKDVDLAEIISDGGESAKTPDRPGMKRLLSLINSGQVDVVIISKLDRLTRSVKDLADLLETLDRRGVSLVSVAESLDTKSAAGRLVINIMMSVSQWERETIGERTRDVLQHKKSLGQCVGNVPFGYRLGNDGVHLEEHPDKRANRIQIEEPRVALLKQRYRTGAPQFLTIASKTRAGTRCCSPDEYADAERCVPVAGFSSVHSSVTGFFQ